MNLNRPNRLTLKRPLGRTGTGTAASGANALPTRSASADTLQSEAGGTLPLCFGLQRFAGGTLIYHVADTDVQDVRFATALGDGGERGWGGMVAAYYAGAELDESPDDVTPGYRFHPGTLSTGFADADQGADEFFGDEFTASGTAYAAVLLPAEYAVEDTPGKFSCVAQCALVPDFDAIGNLTGWSYSANPARVAAYGLFVDTVNLLEAQGTPSTDPIVYEYLRRRVNWGSWWNWRNVCAEEISWNDGTSTRDIARFECHLRFDGAIKIDEFLDAVCGVSATTWQDDEGVISFLTPFDTTPVHHFSDGSDGARCNVFEDYGLEPADLQAKTRHVIATFGDTDTDLLDETQVEWRGSDLIKRFGESRVEVRQFPNMTGSQAQRLLRRQMLLEVEYTEVVRLVGHGDSLHVLKGDFVTVTNERAGWVSALALVVAAENQSAEAGADKSTFTLQRIAGDLYRDDWHGVIQRAVTPS